MIESGIDLEKEQIFVRAQSGIASITATLDPDAAELLAKQILKNVEALRDHFFKTRKTGGPYIA